MIESDETYDHDTDISKWLENIATEADELVRSEDDGDRDNILENQPFASYFIKLCKMLPIWSAISCKFFNSPNLIGSSWSSETNFKNTKQLHGDNIPCSVDEFVKRDLQLNNSTVIEASKKYIKKSARIDQIPNQNTTLKPKTTPKTQRGRNTKNSTQIKEKSENTANVECIACKDGNYPTGLHKCFFCNKSVHLFDGCSYSINDEEGCGEKRQCMQCYRLNKETSEPKTFDASNSQESNELETVEASNSQETNESEIAEALNSQETWSKSNKKPSKYMKTVPNWGLVPINKKISIPRFENGNLSKTGFSVNRKTVSLSNTCAFDSIVQLIAAAYAYNPTYRSSFSDGIFMIARMMAEG